MDKSPLRWRTDPCPEEISRNRYFDRVICIIGEPDKRNNPFRWFIYTANYEDQLMDIENVPQSNVIAWTQFPDKTDLNWIPCFRQLPTPTDQTEWDEDEPDCIMLSEVGGYFLGWYTDNGWYALDDLFYEDYITPHPMSDFIAHMKSIPEIKHKDDGSIESMYRIVAWMPCPKVDDFIQQQKNNDL